MNEGEKLPNSKRLSKKTITVFIVAFVLITGLATFFGWQLLKSNKGTTEDQNKETAAKIVDAVSKFYDLPANEKPTVALIQDKTKLVDQVFFAKAQDGDYVIVYEKSKLALLYRNQNGKLINVGPITTDTSQSGATDSATDKPQSTTSTGSEKKR